MQLNELTIVAFGQFKNRHFQFEPGLSVILGNNEQGKSTLLACIKAMFFGLSGRGRQIRDNERLRYQPWDGSRMAAYLVFQHNGLQYRLERSFGKTKANDRCTLMNNVTGKTIDLPSQQEVGPALFNVTLEEFTNTVFIGQLQSPLASPDHSTLGKLANLSGSLDEGVSQRLVEERLQTARIKLRHARGAGGLIPDLQRQIEAYEQQRLQAIDAEVIQQNHIRQLDELNGLIVSEQQQVAVHKARLARWELNEKTGRLERLAARQAELARLEEGLTQQRQNLVRHDRVIDGPAIEQLREQLRSCRQCAAEAAALEQQVDRLRAELAVAEGEICRFKPIEGLDRVQVVTTQDHLTAARHELILQKQAEQLTGSTALLTESEQLLRQHEQQAERVQAEIRAAGYSPDSLRNPANDLGREAAEHPVTLADSTLHRPTPAWSRGTAILAGLGVLAVLGGLAGLVLTARTLFGGVIALGILLLGLGLTIRSRQSKAAWIHYEHELARQQDQLRGLAAQAAERRSEQSRLAERLRSAEMQAEAVRQTLTARREQDRQLRRRLDPEALETAWSEDQVFRLQAEIETLEAQLNQWFVTSGTGNEVDLLVLINEAQRARQNFEQDIKRLEQKETEFHAAKRRSLQALQELAQQLEAPAAADSVQSAAVFEQTIDKLAQQVAQYQAETGSFTSARQSFAAELNGLDWPDFLAQVRQEIASLRQAAATLEPADPEQLAGTLDSFANSGTPVRESDLEAALAEQQQILKDLELEAEKHRSAIRHSPRLPLMAAEYDQKIAEECEKLRDAQAYFDSLELANELFKVAFDEMQASFGPKLNHEAARILQQLTGQKYSDLKIDRTFAVRLEAPEDRGYHDGDYFSGGTIDQVYLALRLAVSDLVQTLEQRLPLLLDDVFVQYDDERAKAGLEYLFSKVQAEQGQALLLTSHSRMASMAGTISPSIQIVQLD
jgi:uncharacterized protein YhaN